jgi:hypothetical protein
MKRLCAVLALILLFAGTAGAMEFSADTIMTGKGDTKTTGKIFFKADRFRMDMKAPAEMSTITRLDRKVVWSIIPKEKMYMEIPFDLKNKPKVDEKMEGEIERKQVGAESIDGHPTKKYLITYKSGDKQMQMYQWLATDINFPVKTAAQDGSWTQEYRNIRMAAQPDSLFEAPTGYKKMEMPAGMNFNRK